MKKVALKTSNWPPEMETDPRTSATPAVTKCQSCKYSLRNEKLTVDYCKGNDNEESSRYSWGESGSQSGSQGIAIYEGL
jgi:hypothetical protein